jgi:NADH-quinone oxidoreductase subunit C
MDEALREHSEYVQAKLGERCLGADIAFGELTITVRRQSIVEVLRILRDDSQCRYFSFIDLSGADYPGRDERFDVVYHLLSPTQNARIRVKLTTGEETPVPSVCEVFPGAEWYEREAYDLYGIVFSGHPDLRRILTDYGFDGHPMRKDFPLTGFVELRYDEARKRVVYEPVRLNQEFRNFDYLSPWEGTEYVLPGDEKKSGE